ncbi:MAG TPA: tetratricopeptide repeat protein, partial [Candidatus Angelobacter sp.]|nr:tetratricopeptide repeat protein [Candidatus Angelobacter sp.]
MLTLPALADTIVLKSGNRIVADSVTERNGRVEYAIGDNTFTIPKSIVTRIETGPGASVPAISTAKTSGLDEPPPSGEQMPVDNALIARVIRNNSIDISAIKAIEDEGVPAQSAAACAIAAGFEENHNNLPAAARYLESALRYLPNHPVLLENYASMLLQLGRAPEALSVAEQATHADPNSGVAFAILAYAYYKNDRLRDAVAAWKKSLDLHPDEKIKALMERAQRELKAESDFREENSAHFTLRYEGSQAPETLRRQILEMLEANYRDLQNDLGASPRNIFVSLYTDQAFFDVTQAPAWSAALNDGKIRIPISGMSSVSPELARVLRHELTHSFVQQITHGRAPQWLNEGIAEIEGGSSTAAFGPRLAALFGTGHQIPLSQLEAGFQGYSSAEAAVAYAESLAAVEYIRDHYGLSDVARLLQR